MCLCIDPCNPLRSVVELAWLFVYMQPLQATSSKIIVESEMESTYKMVCTKTHTPLHRRIFNANDRKTLEVFNRQTERPQYALKLIGVSRGTIFETPHNNTA